MRFDAVARGDIHILIIPPWSVDAAVLGCRTMVLRFELFDKPLYFISFRARGDEARVCRGDDDGILDADHRGEYRSFGAQQDCCG